MRRRIRWFTVRAENGRGFTLIELLAVMVVLGILMALLLPAILRMNTGARRRRAHAAESAIVTAVETYHQRYHRWPAPHQHLEAGQNIVYGETQPNRHVANRLFFPPDGQAPSDGRLPPEALLDPKHFKVDDQGNLLDPWWSQAGDSQYRIQMNLSYDPSRDRVRAWSPNREAFR